MDNGLVLRVGQTFGQGLDGGCGLLGGNRPLLGKPGNVEGALVGAAHSHSMVPGGFDVTSRATRFTPSTSLMSRLAIDSIRS